MTKSAEEQPPIGDRVPFGTGETLEAATQIGRVVAAYAALEWHMFLIYAALAKGGGEECYVTFFSLRSVRAKEVLVMGRARHRVMPTYMLSGLKKLWRHFKAAATRRTDFAHSVYVTHDDKLMRMTLEGNRIRYHPWKKDFFVQTINQYRSLQREIEVYLVFLFPLRGWRMLDVIATIPHPRGQKHLPPQTVNPGLLPPHESTMLFDAARRLGLPFLEDGQYQPDAGPLIGYTFGSGFYDKPVWHLA